MKNQSNTFDAIYAQALDMFERGLSVEHITQTFPEHADELRDIFSIATMLGNTRETLKPSKDSLVQAIQKIPSHETPRYSSFIETFLHAGSVLRVAVPAGVAILVVGIVLYERNTLIPQPTLVPAETGEFHDTSPAATGQQTDTMMLQQEAAPSAGAAVQKRAGTMSAMAPASPADMYAGDASAAEAALAAEDGTVAQTISDPTLGDVYNENDFVF